MHEWQMTGRIRNIFHRHRHNHRHKHTHTHRLFKAIKKVSLPFEPVIKSENDLGLVIVVVVAVAFGRVQKSIKCLSSVSMHVQPDRLSSPRPA